MEMTVQWKLPFENACRVLNYNVSESSWNIITLDLFVKWISSTDVNHFKHVLCVKEQGISSPLTTNMALIPTLHFITLEFVWSFPHEGPAKRPQKVNLSDILILVRTFGSPLRCKKHASQHTQIQPMIQNTMSFMNT